MEKIKHNINNNINLLFQFNLSDSNSLKLFNESTRDMPSLKALKCSRSGVIVLERYEMPKEYYEKVIHYTHDFKDETKTTKGLIKSKPVEDDIRRFESYKELIKGSEILDFGCGKGEFLELTNKISKRSVGVELHNINREYINNIGIQCVKTISELTDDKFDVITLNHVFEHLNDPIKTLVELQKHLKNDGVLIIEVPHAKDLLLESFNLDSFRNFSLWSEHLILHTRESLATFAINSGLIIKSIEGFQRYPLSNHFHWLLNNEPSGHEVFCHLNNDHFHKNYSKFLNTIDQTDTLIGYFHKNI